MAPESLSPRSPRQRMQEAVWTPLNDLENQLHIVVQVKAEEQHSEWRRANPDVDVNLNLDVMAVPDEEHALEVIRYFNSVSKKTRVPNAAELSALTNVLNGAMRSWGQAYSRPPTPEELQELTAALEAAAPALGVPRFSEAEAHMRLEQAITKAEAYARGLEKVRNSAADLAAGLGAARQTEQYRLAASKETRSQIYWYVVASLMLLIAFCLALFYVPGTGDWSETAGRILVSVIPTSVAAWAATQAVDHRRAAQRLVRLQADLLTFEPFLKGYDDGGDARRLAAQRLFFQVEGIESPTAPDPGLLALVALLTDQIASVQKR